MSATDSIARLRAIGDTLAQRTPRVLAAATGLLESVLEAADQAIATERTPTAPVALTTEQVLEAARARGVPAFTGAVSARLILLASLGLDLTAPGIRAALVEMHRRRELRLAPIDNLDAARADLDARGLAIDLVDKSAIGEGEMIFHAVVVP